MTQRTLNCWLCGLLAAAAVAAALPIRSLQAQQDPAADPFAATTPEADLAALENEDIEILTRGPVHEGFAEPVTFNAEPGLIVPKTPPAPIEEIAPAQRPEGESIWIPGYWGWSEDQKDFLWVSGIWRAPPPDYLEWVPGYWEAAEGGSQWISGYWGSMESDEVAYLPNPPETLEEGPSSDAPSDEYFWVPGNWTWNENRYAWRPGFWSEVRPSWVWVAAHYVWTPSGCIFVDGYWDHPLETRGLLFAPVYYNEPIYTAADYYYTPSIVIDTSILTAHLFARPAYCHYYFGDYYEPSYYQDYGIYPWFVFHERNYGYDPLYSFFRYGRYNNRYDSWRGGLVSRYRWYRDHDDWRPGHNWREQRHQRDHWDDRDRDDGDVDIDIDIENNLIGKNINDRDFRDRNRLREASREEREDSRDRSREVREFQRERARTEGEGGQIADGDEPRRVRRDRSPLARQGDSERSRQRRADRLVDDADGRSREINADAQARQRARLEDQRADRSQRGERGESAAARDRDELDLDVPGPRGDRRQGERGESGRDLSRDIDRGEPDEGGVRLREGVDDRPPSLRDRRETPPQGDGSGRGVLDPDEGARASGTPPGTGTDVDGAIRRGRQRQRETQQPGSEASPLQREEGSGTEGAAELRRQQQRDTEQRQRRLESQDDQGEQVQRQQAEQRQRQRVEQQGERRRQEAQPQTRLRPDTSGEAQRRAAQQEGATRERAQRQSTERQQRQSQQGEQVQRQQQERRSVERAPQEQRRSEPRVERSRSERSSGGEARQRSSSGGGGGEARQRSSGGGGERRQSGGGGGGGGERRGGGGGKRDRD